MPAPRRGESELTWDVFTQELPEDCENEFELGNVSILGNRLTPDETDAFANMLHEQADLARRAVRTHLEYLRGEIRAERISYGEIAELQALVAHIEPDDFELLAWATPNEED